MAADENIAAVLLAAGRSRRMGAFKPLLPFGGVTVVEACVENLREAGAAEVHMRISAPPIRHPCHYGIDMSTTQEMVAHGRSVEEVAAELGCDSLAYLSLDGLYEAVRGTRDTHCDACFTGDYPLERTESANGKFALEELAVVRA